MRRSERRRMSWLAVALLAAAVGVAGRAPAASDGSQAQARRTVTETVDAVLAVLRDDGLSEQAKRERVTDLAYQRFDFDTIAKLVLARNWRRLSPEQRQDFVREFKEHLSLTYGSNLSEYEDEHVEVESTRLEGNGDVTVRTRLVGGPEPVLIDYRLRENGSEWRVIDVVIEGVSMISNFRSQTQEIITERGADGLIEVLREKNEARRNGVEAS